MHTLNYVCRGIVATSHFFPEKLPEALHGASWFCTIILQLFVSLMQWLFHKAKDVTCCLLLDTRQVREYPTRPYPKYWNSGMRYRLLFVQCQCDCFESRLTLSIYSVLKFFHQTGNRYSCLFHSVAVHSLTFTQPRMWHVAYCWPTPYFCLVATCARQETKLTNNIFAAGHVNVHLPYRHL